MEKVTRAFAALLFVVGVAVPSIGIAQGTAEDMGFYIGASIGQSKAKGFCEGVGGPGESCEDTDTALRFLAGYQFNKNFALEFGYHQIGEVSASVPGVAITLEAKAFEFLAVGMIPLADRFSVYGKLGLYMGDTDVRATVTGLGSGSASEDNTDLTYGIGVRYDFTQNFGVRAEWQRYQDIGGGDVLLQGDIDVMSIGVIYRFQ